MYVIARGQHAMLPVATIAVATCRRVCDRDERLRTVEEQLTSQIDELSTIVRQKVAFNDSGELLTSDAQ